jgi:hypothetical protein
MGIEFEQSLTRRQVAIHFLAFLVLNFNLKLLVGDGTWVLLLLFLELGDLQFEEVESI